jgi:hypothetical protein
MHDSRRLQNVYSITSTTLVITGATMLLTLYIVVIVSIFADRINLCTMNSCFGINLKSLIPDYSGQINQLQTISTEQTVKLSQQLTEIQAQLTQLQQLAVGLGRRN